MIAPEVPQLDDRLVRVIGVPVFGVVVPRISGVLDGLSSSMPLYWVGTGWSILAVAVICHGTRGAYLARRDRGGTWMDQPLRKLVRLLAAILLFTIPPTVLSLAAWNAVLGTTAWRSGLLTLGGAVVGVVVMVYLYEFAFLLKDRAAERARLLHLDRARAEAELAAVGAQVDPHFLFNSLNTLGHLITTDPRRASIFTAHLAALHHYVLRTAASPLVTLEEELQFLQGYVTLMSIRFGAAFQVSIVEPDAGRGAARGAQRHPLRLTRLPPTALQLLVENAIKHNEGSEAHPLLIVVSLGVDAVTVHHERRPCRTVRPSAGSGLANLDERVQRTMGRGISVERQDGTFSVRVPLAPALASSSASFAIGSSPQNRLLSELSPGPSASGAASPAWLAEDPTWAETRIQEKEG